MAERAFDTGPSWFSAGPAWLMNAMPGSNFRARNYVIDSAGDCEDSTTEASYVGTLHDVFNVNLFNNVATFGVASGSKTSTTTLAAAGTTYTWTNSGTTDFNLGTNWTPSGGPPTTSDTATFTGTASINPQLTAPTSILQLAYTTTGISYILSTSNAAVNSLQLTGTGTGTSSAISALNTSGTNTISAPINLAAASGTQTFSQAGGGTLSVSGVISSTNPVTLSLTGGGTIQFSGPNTYGGTTTIGASTTFVAAGSNSSSGATTVVNSTSVLKLSSANPLASGLLTLTAGRIQSLDATARSLANQVSLGNNNVTFGAASTGSLTFSGSTTLTGTSTWTVTSDTTFSNSISGSTFGFTKAGSGILMLSGTVANTFDGLTTVSTGELDLNKAGVNAIAGNLTIGDGAGTDTVKLLAADQIANTSDVTINSSGVLNLSNNNETIDALNSSSTTASILLGSGTLTVGANNEGSFAYAGASSGTGGITKTGSGILILSGANAYIGDTTIAAGRLLLSSNGSLASSSRIRLGDTIANSPTAGFTFGTSGGGITLSNPMTVQASSSGTQGTRTLSGTAVNGNTNTYSGVITLNTGLLVQSANSGSSLATTSTAGILLFQGGSIDFGTSGLTVNSNVDGNNADTYSAQGTVRLNEALTSSNATGGSIVKDGSGTLIIQSTGNSYTGSTGAGVALNANGTRIGGGILAIFDDTSLGIAPATSANNVFFTTSALNQNVDSIQPTLRADANNITLAATRNINIAGGVTGRIDSNGNTFTIAGNINGANGNFYKTGAGTLVLTGANTYTGTTTINQGTLNAAANGALGSGVGGTATGTTSIQVNSSGTLMLSNSSATDRVRDDAGITLGSGGSASIVRSGPDVVSEGSGAQVTNGVVTGGMSTVGLGSLTLQSNSTLNFGTLGVGTLTFAGFNPGTFTLTISNWTSSASLASLTSGTDGTDDRLIFAGITPPNTTFITFDGTAAAFIPLDTGFWEVVPVPETSTWVTAALALGAVVFAQRRRLRGFWLSVRG